ncbi:MAG: PIN domain-containing protein [Armatimonadetes bacterium]|nr:PIN domain-containing protein [Armatimonadota bacterium]
MPTRLVDSSIWVRYLRPRPDRRIVRAVREVLAAGEVAVAAPIVVEVLSGIRDPKEYGVRESDFRALPHVPTDGEAAYVAARLGEALARAGLRATTVDLLLAGAAIVGGAELWSLPDAHFEQIHELTERGTVAVPGPFRFTTFS